MPLARLRTPLFLAAVFAVAVCLRLGFTVAYRGSLATVPVHDIAGSDGVEYDGFARSVLAGRGYSWADGTPTSFRAPGFPFALVAVYSLFGTSTINAYVFFALCGGLGAVSAYALGRELRGESFARWAALVAAIYPPDIYAWSYFFSEVVFAPTLGFGLALLARQPGRRAWLAALAAGLLLGYAALTRSFAVLFLPAFALFLAWRLRWRDAVLYSLGFLAVVLPWTARNYQAHGKFVLIATNGGSTFYGANNPVVNAVPKEWGNWVATNRLPGRAGIEAQPDEVSHDKEEFRLGVEWVKAHPLDFAKLGVFKLVRFGLPFVQWPSFKVYPVPNILFTLPFLIPTVVGIGHTLRTRDLRRQFAVCHITLACNLAMVVVFWGDPRFRDANVPVIAAYAVAGAMWGRGASGQLCRCPGRPARYSVNVTNGTPGLNQSFSSARASNRRQPRGTAN
jgi:4-amino-4-deoxy-L-arabinose transferase-like glycosyltransferase